MADMDDFSAMMRSERGDTDFSERERDLQLSRMEEELAGLKQVAPHVGAWIETFLSIA